MLVQILNGDSYQLSAFAFPTFVTASMVLTLGLTVFFRERDTRVRVSFFVMTTTVAVWLYGYSFMYCARTAELAAAWGHAAHIGITFIPAAVFHFTVTALRTYHRHRRQVWMIWMICAIFLVGLLPGNHFISGVRSFWWGPYPQYGWLGVSFVSFFFGLMAMSLWEYWNAYRTALPGVLRLRNRNLLAAFGIAYLGSVDYLPAMGVSLYPFGYLPLLGFVALVGQTIKRHRLVNITPELAAKEIIHAMEEALLVMDNEGVVRVANPIAGQIFRRSETELEGASIVTLAHAWSATPEQLARRIIEGTLRDDEFSMNDGAITVSISSFRVLDAEENRIATVCMIRDVSQAKAAEQQIAEHTERQAALYELNLASTSTLELKEVLNILLDRLERFVPRCAVTVLLYEPNQPLRKVACRNTDESAWRCASPKINENLHPVLAAKDVVWLPDMRQATMLMDADYFSTRGFRSYLGLPLIAKSRVIGILSFYAEEERNYTGQNINFLRSLAGQAAAAIHNSALYEETSRQATALEKANQVKDDFLSIMSHELRTPLNVISGYTRLVEDGVMGEINADQRKALDIVGRHTDELLFMINSIMNAARIEARVLVVDVQEFALGDLLTELKRLYDYPRAKPVHLEWDYPDDLPTICSDRDKLKHIVQNLINNALKFTDGGYVVVRARYRAADQGVEISVTDTGIGIPDEELAGIFDRFRQLDSSRTRAHGGVGLGLHIVKTFANLLGGTIRVSSHPGRGSTFTLELPGGVRDPRRPAAVDVR